MQSNAYFLAKFRFDTAENEPAKNLQNNSAKLLNLPSPRDRVLPRAVAEGTGRHGDHHGRVSRPASSPGGALAGGGAGQGDHGVACSFVVPHGALDWSRFFNRVSRIFSRNVVKRRDYGEIGFNIIEIQRLQSF